MFFKFKRIKKFFLIFFLILIKFFIDISNPVLISNRNLIERLNQKVLNKKIEAIANSIILGMSDEMRKLVFLKLFYTYNFLILEV